MSDTKFAQNGSIATNKPPSQMTKKLKPGQHMGLAQLADILSIITAEPMTAKQVSDVHPCSLPRLRGLLRMMSEMCIAHVCGWQAGQKGPAAAIYAGGDGQDAPLPDGYIGSFSRRSIKRIRPNALMILFCSIVRAFREGGTATEIAAMSGAHIRKVTDLAKYMWQIGLIYIEAWDRAVDGPHVRVWKLGRKRDAKRPRPVTQAERNAKRIAGQKAKQEQTAVLAALRGSRVAEGCPA